MTLLISPIVYQHENCLNTKKPFAQDCRICVEVCPHEALSEYHEISVQHCTECGLCVAACPSNGIIYRMAHQLEEYLLSDKEELVLSCSQAQSEGLAITCLGLLDRDAWSTLVLLAGNKRVDLITGDCSTCPNKPAFTETMKVLKELYADWPGHAKLNFYVKPVIEETAAKPSELNSRRIWNKKSQEQRNEAAKRKELQLKGLRKRSIQAIENLLSDTNEDNKSYSIPLTRRCLLQAMEKNPQVKVPFRVLTVASECISCRVCVSVCPQEALRKRKEGEKQQLLFDPLKCVQCGRCIKICPPQALSLQVKFISADLLNSKILIHEGGISFCSKCGRQILDNNELNLCRVCATNDDRWLDFFQK